MLDFIKKHKYGIAGTLVFHLLLVAFFSIKKVDLPAFEKKSPVLLTFDFTEEIEDIEESDEMEELLEDDNNLSEDAINEKIQNLMRDANDRRKKSNKNFTEQEIEAQLEQKYKDLEQQIIENRKKQGKGFDPSKYESTFDKNAIQNETSSSANDTQAAGRVATECSIPERKCYAKTPAYRCPSSGKVFIDIKINQKGEVISAKVNERKSTTSDACITNEALKYAKMLRANQDFNAPKSQNGFVSFHFIEQ